MTKRNIESRINLLERETSEIKGLREFKHEANKTLHTHDNAIKELLKSPTNQDLHIMLVKLDSKLDNVLDKQKDIAVWQDKHQEADNKNQEANDNNFKSIAGRLDSLSGLSTKVGIICTVLGMVGTKIYDYFKGN